MTRHGFADAVQFAARRPHAEQIRMMKGTPTGGE